MNRDRLMREISKLEKILEEYDFNQHVQKRTPQNYNITIDYVRTNQGMETVDVFVKNVPDSHGDSRWFMYMVGQNTGIIFNHVYLMQSPGSRIVDIMGVAGDRGMIPSRLGRIRGFFEIIGDKQSDATDIEAIVRHLYQNI